MLAAPAVPLTRANPVVLVRSLVLCNSRVTLMESRTISEAALVKQECRFRSSATRAKGRHSIKVTDLVQHCCDGGSQGERQVPPAVTASICPALGTFTPSAKSGNTSAQKPDAGDSGPMCRCNRMFECALHAAL